MAVIALFIDYENVHYGLVNQYRFKPDAARLTALILAEVAKRLGIMSEGERPQGTGPVLVKG